MRRRLLGGLIGGLVGFLIALAVVASNWREVVESTVAGLVGLTLGLSVVLALDHFKLIPPRTPEDDT